MTVRKKKASPVPADIFEVHLGYLKEGIAEIRAELSKLSVKVENQEKTLLRNTLTVEEHQKRSTLMEERQEATLKVISEMIEKLNDVKQKVIEIENDVEPIKEHTRQVNKIMKLFIVTYDNKDLIGKIIIFSLVITGSILVGLNKSAIIDGILSIIQ